jgi:D-alanyl-D-alanine carboxypeptidase (penicillin-binding protein 5/6)
VELYTYERRRSSSAPLVLGLGVVGVAMLALVALQLVRSVPSPTYSISLAESSVLGQSRTVALPEDGSAVVSVSGLGVLGQSGPVEAKPIASVTKMMTAYVILKNHPLAPGQPGPTLNITQADVSRYLAMLAQDQSVQPVNAGGVLTELQLIQGMLIPSANNYAEILAAWDAGSVVAFVDKMNAEAAALGMTNTHYDDVSGFSAKSVSTAEDQLSLARAALSDPVFAATVATEQVTLPAAGTLQSTNRLLGTGGVVGIKTGSTEEAGANLAFAARHEAAGQTVEVIGVVLGQNSYMDVFDETIGVLNSVNDGVQAIRVVPAGQPVGTVDPSWGGPGNLVVTQDVNMIVWPGMTLETSVEIEDIDPGQKGGEQVGWLNVRLGEQEQRVPLALAKDVGNPDIFWKLTRF